MSCNGQADSSEPPLKAQAMAIRVTVPGGGEIHKCRFVKVEPGLGTHVVRMEHSYTPGSHHLLLFRTDLNEVPAADGTEAVDCYADGRDIMSHVRGVVYASQNDKADMHLPAGVGLPLAPGEVLLLQAHYLNAGAAPLDARVDVKLSFGAQGSVTEDAGVLFFYQPFIFVPARGSSSTLMRCNVPRNVKLLSGLSHMHKRGVGFEAFLDAPGGELAPTSFYSSTDWQHPPSIATPLDVPAGSRLRFRCDYQNGSENEALQGQSADRDEMCIFTGLYHPAMPDADSLCLGAADMLGGGDKSCLDTLTCLRACPPGTAPKIGLANGAEVHPCWQKCFAAACPTAGVPALRQLSCLGKNCADDCADTNSATCIGCVTKSCATEFSTCSAATCTK